MFRFLTFRNVSCVALAIGAIAVAATAQAQSKIKLLGAGQGALTFQDDPDPQNPVGLQEYTGDGWITLAGKGDFIGSHNFAFSKIPGQGFVFNGVVNTTNSDGSTLRGTYDGTFAVIPNTVFIEFTIDVLWKGGEKSRLAGYTGEAEVTAVLNTVTGEFEDTQEGYWFRPKK
jgi:hypothetical protein